MTVETTDAWRGVAAEGAQDITEAGSVFLRRRSRRLLGELLRPYRRIAWLLLLAVLIENAARLSIPWLVQRGIDLGIPPLAESGSSTVLIEIIAVMVVAVICQALARIWFLRESGRIGQRILLTIRRRLFGHFQKLDVAFHDRYTSGRVVSRLTSDVEAIAEMVNAGVDSLITAVLTMVGVGVLLLVLDFELGLICLLTFVPLMLLVRWFARQSSRIYRRVRELSALVIVQFVESMTGIRAVQAYRRQGRNDEIFSGLSRRYADANLDAFRLVAIFMPAVGLVGNLAICAVVVFGGAQVIEREISLGVLAAFLLYLRMFFAPMQEISQFYNTFQSAISALEKLSGVLEERPGVAEPADPLRPAAARGELRLDHVGFSYVDGVPVLPDLDLTIPAGQTVALVGTTGAGKTTIAKLFARFYDPTSGRVLLDGVDVRGLADDELRERVVLVTQENFMFEGTIGDNIAFGRPGASAEEIRAAARAVGVDVFIDSLPDGYATDVGKRGGRLSAGQRQLIAFARAFLADPAVLILDEATSSLDIPSERLVQRALRTVLADRTAVIIAHRLSTVEIADRVLVLEHGQVLEDGSPVELMNRRDGRYARLYEAWAGSLA
ncbi:ABC-type multidrug transport system fused ATPase/permease subunit [Naumannella cuiyingiana]|uniref:ABC-type multidrug transport system fused ATPase/permease subunit n=1 Tax=Naumannella cuiyingiana TaxID=1347891 RepID=A0A7Z0D8X5_9ACTN|nr:ABC transporter ATP-binding protein [Naumannella cuiyingiana]NYI70888.1 ABC-type multidrug transport system fused ATPase/permease subunit [Naumannella cuiyingiana]